MPRSTVLRAPLALAVILTACGEPPTQPLDEEPSDSVEAPVIAGVSMNVGALRLIVGDTVRLSAVAVDPDGDTIPELPVAWTSTNDAVVSVDSAGRLEATGPGRAYIEAAIEEWAVLTAADVHEDIRCAMFPHDVLPRGQGNLNDEFAWAATRVPGGFGGVWLINGATEARFHLVDMAQADTAADVVYELYRDWIDNVPRERWAAVQADYDWLELYGCYKESREVALTSPGVFSSDIHESKNRLEYGVTSEAEGEELLRRIEAAGFPVGMFSYEVGQPPSWR